MSEYFEELKKMIDPGKGYDMERIEKAYLLAEKAHSGQFRASGEPYIVHPVEAAKITVQLGMDTDTVVTALLHDVVEDTDITLEEIKKEFGTDVANLVDGVTKLKQIKKVNNASKEEQQAENVRKMFMAMAKDIRVIIVKLADRLHNMRTIDAKPVEKQRRIAHETMEIYAPLAHRLGIRPIMEELEDRCIRVLDPVGYHDIESRMEMQKDEQKEFLDHIKNKIDERLRKENCEFYLMGRIKSVYGIYRKIYEQGKSMEEIYDIYAVRVIVNTVYDCYYVLGVMHDLFRPIPDRFKDYISTPKQNMYQSLHTTCIDSKGIPFEIQIRTWDMHHTAEYGIAAHWQYKENKVSADSFDKRLSWIREVMEWQGGIKNSKEFLDSLKGDIYNTELLVFTPKGEVISLVKDSTPIDFAYRIHTEVGNKCVGAKVNGKMVPLTTTLKVGDIVEIITSANSKGPSWDWLKIVKTSGAKAKIRAFFKREAADDIVKTGKTMLEAEAKNKGYNFGELLTPQSFERVAQKFAFNGVDEMYAAVGCGAVTVNKVLMKLIDFKKKESRPEEPLKPAISNKIIHSTGDVDIEGVNGLLIRFARCCNPVPGDPIVGYISRGRGVAVHRKDCPNMRGEDPARLLKATWTGKSGEEGYSASLRITAKEDALILPLVSTCSTKYKTFILSINGRIDNKNHVSIMDLTLKINKKEDLENMIKDLRADQSVIDVFRITN